MSAIMERTTSRTLTLTNVGWRSFLGFGFWAILRPSGTIVALHTDTFTSPATNWDVQLLATSTPPYSPVRVFVPATNGVRDPFAAPSGEYEVHYRGAKRFPDNPENFQYEDWVQSFSVPGNGLPGSKPGPCD